MRSNGFSRSSVAPVTALIAVAVLLCGCGSSSSDEGGTSASDEVAVALDADPAAFGYDPASTSGGGVTTYWQALYSSLFTTNAEGDVEPSLATDYSFNDDKTQISLTLRDGVTFTDGTTLDAQLVGDNLARRSDPSLGSYGMFGPGGTAEITAVDTPDAKTVVITFSKPQAAAPSFLADSAGRIVGGEAIKNPAMLQTTPDGAGPYTLDTDRTVKGSTYTLVKNTESWAADSAGFETLVFQVQTNPQTRANSLVSGQAQVAQLDPSTVSMVESDDEVVSIGGTIYGFPLFDKSGATAEPFKSVQVRQALSMAIDREAVAALNPGAQATASFFPSDTPGYDEELDTKYATDIDQAKQLLAEAGYPDGFSFTLVTVGTQYLPTLQAVQADWQKIGVNLEIKQTTSYSDALQSQSTTPLGYGYWMIGEDPIGYVSGYLLGGTLNSQHATDTAITSALEAASSGEGNEDEAALTQLNDAIVDEGWFIPIFEQPVYIGYDSSAVSEPQSSGSSPYPLVSSIAP